MAGRWCDREPTVRRRATAILSPVISRNLVTIPSRQFVTAYSLLPHYFVFINEISLKLPRPISQFYLQTCCISCFNRAKYSFLLDWIRVSCFFERKKRGKKMKQSTDLYITQFHCEFVKNETLIFFINHNGLFFRNKSMIKNTVINCVLVNRTSFGK